MTKEIQVIKANGETYSLDKAPDFQQLQKIVGGYFEHVRVLDRIEKGRRIYTSMYVNETGLLDGLPRNQKATEIYQRNIRAQYPSEANPFETARREYEADMKEKGVTIINATPKEAAGYQDDPWICGDVIYFQGYTCDEADALLDAA